MYAYEPAYYCVPTQAAQLRLLRPRSWVVRAGLPTLGTVLSPVDPVLEKRQQHRTYSNAFVGQLHAFVETAIADAQVPLCFNTKSFDSAPHPHPALIPRLLCSPSHPAIRLQSSIIV